VAAKLCVLAILARDSLFKTLGCMPRMARGGNGSTFLHFAGLRQPPAAPKSPDFVGLRARLLTKGVFRKVDGHSAQLRGHWASKRRYLNTIQE
jgi:hypothetical protein